MASVKVNKNLPPPVIEPAALFGSVGYVELRIATGGAGQSGLLQALAEAFIAEAIRTSTNPPFRISWQATDTSLSFNALATGSADLAITYLPAAETVALRQGIADSITYAWRDHWLLVGPSTNPAHLPTSKQTSIYELFALLFQAAIETQSSESPVRFLSRYDKSANNITESRIWATIGQTPWSFPYSNWYHRYTELPFGALRAAAKLGEYTLVDRGTWCCLLHEVKDSMTIFAESFDASEDDPLLNPAHALVGTSGANKATARRFATWLKDEDGGQKVISNFSRNGMTLYSPAPSGVDPLDRVKGLF